MRKRLLVLTPYYWPDLGPSSPIYTALCEKLTDLGYTVSVICQVPNYPSGKVSKQWRKRLFYRDIVNGVNVIRVWVPSVNRSNLLMRQLSFLIYQIFASIVGLCERYDAILVTNPAIEVVIPHFVLGVFRRSRIIYAVQDIYPDVGVKLGIFRSPLVINTIEYLEHACFRTANIIQVISEGFKAILLMKGIPAAKIAVVSNGVDTNSIYPIQSERELLEQMDLTGAFIIMHAGNIGLSQGLEFALETARLLDNNLGIHFIFVGDGVNINQLKEKSTGLLNVHFVPFQPREQLNSLLSIADVMLISLKTGISADSVPSKCYTYMASGKPIIAAVEEQSDTWNLLNHSSAGLRIDPGSHSQLAEAVLYLYENRDIKETLGKNGRFYVEQYHSFNAMAQQVKQLLERL